jgi:phosphatidate phosphatase
MSNLQHPVHWLKISFDFFTILLLFSVFQLLKIFATPYKSGFYCNDYSVNLPFKSSTVTNLTLILTCVIMPFVFLFLTELTRSLYSRKRVVVKYIYKIRLFKNQILNVSEHLGNLYINCGSLFFGLAATVIITDLTKMIVGRLRPNFLDVCKPSLSPFKDLCSLPNRTYLVPGVDFECTSPDTPSIDESRLSFPSGHASISFYSMVFLILFINQTWKFTRLGLLPRLVQFFLFAFALFVALSRISDNKHHPTDVLAGALLGSFVSLLTFCYLTDLLKKRSNYNCYSSPESGPRGNDFEDDQEMAYVDDEDDGYDDLNQFQVHAHRSGEHDNSMFESLNMDRNNNNNNNLVKENRSSSRDMTRLPPV